MKRLLAIALTATAGLLMTQVAAAQSCTGFSGTIAGASGSTSGNSCQAAGQTLAKACGNTETFNGAGQAIFEVTVGATNSYTISVTSTDFHPWLGYISGTCSSNTACIDDVTTGAVGTISTAAHTQADTPGGTYFLIVGDLDIDTPGCGDFTVDWGANLPVKLQKFSVN